MSRSSNIKLLSVFIIFSLGPTLIANAAQSVDAISDEGLQSIYGPASARIRTLKEAPTIDGNVDDPTWANIPKILLRFADQRVDGTPIYPGSVKIAVHGDDVYIALWALGRITSPQQPEPDHSIVLTGHSHYMGLVWKTSTDKNAPVYCTVVNSVGGFYHAKKTGAKVAWDKKWNPIGFKTAFERTDYGWTAEIKLSKKNFVDADGKLPSLWSVDFVRRHWHYQTPINPGIKTLRACQAWKARDIPANRRLVTLNVFPPEDFGVLYFPKANTPLPSKTIIQLTEASTQLAEESRKQENGKTIRRPGFEFSESELAAAYPKRPILLVSKVTKPPAIDGDPDDSVWQATRAVSLGFLSTIIKQKPKRNQTFVRMVTDEKFLYALITCEESNLANIKATPGLIDSGGLWNEDICNLLLDVGRQEDEGSNGFVDIGINPAGSVTHYRRRADTSWDPKSLVFKTKLYPDRKQWIIEMKIAFQDLSITPNNLPKVWGANFLRSRTPDRGVWIDRVQTEDLAYMNFDYAWRGNEEASPHRPDLFGIIYLQAGNALPDRLYEQLINRDGQESVKNFKRWKPTPIEKIEIQKPNQVTHQFAQKPSVRHTKKGVEIQFEMQADSDVRVAIYTKDGSLVRALAAGVLGKNAPQPFATGTRKQKLIWDQKDDHGQKVAPGAYVVKVGSGLKATHERFLMYNPNGLTNITGLATDATGNVYVSQIDLKGPYHAPLLTVFNRDGTYKRQMLPYSGKLPDKDLSAAKRIELPNGRKIPAIFHGFSQSFAPSQAGFGQARFSVLQSGDVLLLNQLPRSESRLPKRLVRIKANGGIGKDFLGPLMGPNARGNGIISMATSPDERFLYLTGLRGGWSSDDIGSEAFTGPASVHHVVYRIDLETWNENESEYPKPFIGSLGWAGKGKNRLRKPAGLCVDKAGNLYVADAGNDRVAIFEPGGKLIHQLAVNNPNQVEIDPNTGALYVLSLGKEYSTLSRFKDGKAMQPETNIQLPKWSWTLMAMDASREKPRFWITGQEPVKKGQAREIFAIDDTGTQLTNRGNIIGKNKNAYLNRSTGLPSLAASRIGPYGKKALIQGIAVDTETGKIIEGRQGLRQLGQDGLLYSKTFNPIRGIRKLSSSGKMIPFAKGQKGILPINKPMFEFDVDKKGQVYVIKSSQIDLYSADGELIKKGYIIIPQTVRTSHGANGTIRVDANGNVYIDATIKPLDQEIPLGLMGRLPEVEHRPALPFVYRHSYGSVLKFKAGGGKVTLDKSGDWAICRYFSGKQLCTVEGVDWIHFGMSPLRHRNVQHLFCTCETARFDVDQYGRVFLPDAVRFAVEVLDTNGNTIMRLGQYGNMDDGGIATEEPSFAWPMMVSVRGDRMFVTDKINKRIVSLKLSYQVEQKIELEVK